MSTPETPPTGQETNREQSIDLIRTQLQELQASLGNAEKVSHEAEDLALALAPLAKMEQSERTEKEQKILNAFGLELVNDPTTLEVLRGIKDHVEDARTDLLVLAGEVNAADLTDELAALEGNPEKNPAQSKSVIPLLLGAVDKGVGMLQSSNALGERGKGFMNQISGYIRSFTLRAIEKFASVDVPIVGKFNLLSPADIAVLADYRFAENLQAVQANATLKSEYEKKAADYEKQWRLAYSTWITNQSTPQPVLGEMVAKAPVQPSTTPEQPNVGVFAADEVQKKIEAGKELTAHLPGDKKLLIQSGKVIAQLPGTPTKSVQILNGNTVLTIESLDRANSSLVNAADFTVVLNNNAGSVPLGSLLTAIEQVTEAEAVEIAGTTLTVQFLS